MEITSLSWLPNQPSLLFSYPNATILLDCAMDMNSLGHFLPNCTVNKDVTAWQSTSSSHSHVQLKKTLSTAEGLTRIGKYAFVDGIPEFHPALLNNVDAGSIDAILISNWSSLLALPFITERTSFRGSIYATGPTIQLGKLVLEELSDMLERVDREDPLTEDWRRADSWNCFANALFTDASEWKQFCTRSEIESCLTKITEIYFRQSILINGALRISPSSSGYSIGSCNWVIETEIERIGYMAATSSRATHTKPIDLEPLKGVNTLLLTSLSQLPDAAPESMVVKITSALAETLKNGGNVLIPILPTGVLYDFFELVFAAIENHNLSRDIPVYFISVVADSTLAYSNIYAEWLSEEKSSKAYVPEDPFIHSELVKCGRLKVYDHIHGAFSREFRQPCIVFTGHPSLRIGDVVDFLDLWGNDARNSIIMTNPDYPLDPFYNPYKSLAIRAYFFPIETRLDHMQVTMKVLPDLAPKLLIVPQHYTVPIRFHDKTLTINYKCMQTFAPNVKLTLPYRRRRKRVLIDSDLLSAMKVRGHVANSEVGMCVVKGFLSAYDNELKVNCKRKLESEIDGEPSLSALDGPSTSSAVITGLLDKWRCVTGTSTTSKSLSQRSGRDSICQYRGGLYGRLSAEKLIKVLAERKMKCTIETLDDAGDSAVSVRKIKAVNVNGVEAEVLLEMGGQRTRIRCGDQQQRHSIQSAVYECLKSM